MNHPDNIRDLVTKKFEGTITVQEQTALNKFLKAKSGRMKKYTDATKLKNVTDHIGNMRYANNPEQAARLDDLKHQAFNEDFGKNSPELQARALQTLTRYFKQKYVWISIAAFAIVASIFIINLPKRLPDTNTSAGIANVIKPGTTAASLILADGKELQLTQTQSGTVTTQGDINVSIQSGQLMYKEEAERSVNTQLYNTLTTAKGQQYSVTLSDGSVIHLNAQSSIHFPVAFSTQNRIVELTGEAYLEVAKMPHNPFIVKFRNNSIEVKGTTFNVNTYEDEPLQAITLVEGSIKLNSGKDSKIMIPGQLAKVNAIGKIDVTQIDTTEITAWHNGLFSFEKADLNSVMRQICRWYDIDVEYKNDVTGSEFSGIIDRSENLQEALNILSTSNVVHFEVRGRKVIVTR